MSRSVTAIETIVTDLSSFINQDLYLGALNTAGVTTEVCFDCTLWNTGYVDNSTTIPTVIIPPIKTTIIGILSDVTTFLNDELADTTITDFGFKTQIERLYTVVQDLSNKVNSIQCSNNTCSDVTLTSQLLATLVTTSADLISILEYLNGLLAYMNICGCVGSVLFDVLMGKFINSITDLQGIMQDWYGIVMTFFQYSAMPSKPYVASYMPQQPITPPPAPGPMQFACVPAPPQPNMQGRCPF